MLSCRRRPCHRWRLVESDAAVVLGAAAVLGSRRYRGRGSRRESNRGDGGLNHATRVGDLGLRLTKRTGTGEITLSMSERRKMRVAGDLAR